ncbi:MAG: hypothetical protein MJ149_01845 [Clostridia bacterium]|nr:hypothetical protein [Clostridia bacterium]
MENNQEIEQYKHISANDIKCMINVSSAFAFWLQNNGYNALKANKVGFDKLYKSGQLEQFWDTSILKTHEAVMEHVFVYIYETFKNSGFQLSPTTRAELNRVLTEFNLYDALRLNNLNQEALLKKIRESFAHNDETQDEANRQYTITGNIYGRKIKLANGYIEVSNMAMCKIIDVLIHNLQESEELKTINIICNNEKVFGLLRLGQLNADNFEQHIKLQDEESHTILHLDNAQRQGFVEYLKYYLDAGLDMETMLCNAYSSVRLDVHERALEINDTMQYVAEYFNAVDRAMPYKKFVDTCAEHRKKPAPFVEKEAIHVLSNLYICQLFKILSTNTIISLQDAFADLNLDMDQLRRVRNSIMHGRYFKHNTTVEFYDGKDNNAYWTHIASVDMFAIEKCVEKFCMNFERHVADYLQSLKSEGIDIGDPIKLD